MAGRKTQRLAYIYCMKCHATYVECFVVVCSNRIVYVIMCVWQTIACIITSLLLS